MAEVVKLPELRGATHGGIEIATLTRPIVAIVNFKSERERLKLAPGQRLLLYQVTLDPSRISPSGEHICLGNTTGDQITGWQPLADLEVVEVLCQVTTDGAEAGQVPQLDCMRNRKLTMEQSRALQEPSPS